MLYIQARVIKREKEREESWNIIRASMHWVTWYSFEEVEWDYKLLYERNLRNKNFSFGIRWKKKYGNFEIYRRVKWGGKGSIGILKKLNFYLIEIKIK